MGRPLPRGQGGGNPGQSPQAKVKNRTQPIRYANLGEQPAATWTYTQEEFQKAMEKNICVIFYQKAERMIATCCNSVICQTCLHKQNSMG